MRRTRRNPIGDFPAQPALLIWFPASAGHDAKTVVVDAATGLFHTGKSKERSTRGSRAQSARRRQREFINGL